MYSFSYSTRVHSKQEEGNSEELLIPHSVIITFISWCSFSSSFWMCSVLSKHFCCSSPLLALCTVLHLTERLFLDHPHRLTGSKVQYVRLTFLSPWAKGSEAGGSLRSGCVGDGRAGCGEARIWPSPRTVCPCGCRQYHRALVAVLLSRTWHVRRQAQQTVRKLLASLGGFKLAYGLLEELKTVLSSHKVRASGVQNWDFQSSFASPAYAVGCWLRRSWDILTQTL